MTPYTFRRQNRNSRTVVILIAVYAALLTLIIVFDAAWWLVGLLSVATLPAVWDILQDSSAGMSMEADQIAWYSGKRQGHINLQEIDYFRFDTRWDFSVRVSMILTTGKRVRLPDESLPPHRTLEKILENAGFTVRRHHFTVF
ncbi:MAG: hypothetical protein AAF496_11320 [Pseudomonadota bacterium]